MNDRDVSLEDIKKRINDFAIERSWLPFHTPKNLSMALAGEAAELMEHFFWVENSESKKQLDDPEKLMAVQEELADVLIYAFQFANQAGIDVSQAIADKMEKNAIKYPAPS